MYALCKLLERLVQTWGLAHMEIDLEVQRHICSVPSIAGLSEPESLNNECISAVSDAAALYVSETILVVSF